MLCQECNSGFLCEPTPKPLVIHYRGFSKTLDSQIYLSCSNCLYESAEPVAGIVDVDAEMVVFEREINKQLSVGELM